MIKKRETGQEIKKADPKKRIGPGAFRKLKR
jgi:hypothetical protein